MFVCCVRCSETLSFHDVDLTQAEIDQLYRWEREEKKRQAEERKIEEIERHKSFLDTALSAFDSDSPVRIADIPRALSLSVSGPVQPAADSKKTATVEKVKSPKATSPPPEPKSKSSPSSKQVTEDTHDIPSLEDYREPWYIRLFCCTEALPQRTAAEQVRYHRKAHKWRISNAVHLHASACFCCR